MLATANIRVAVAGEGRGVVSVVEAPARIVADVRSVEAGAGGTVALARTPAAVAEAAADMCVCIHPAAPHSPAPPETATAVARRPGVSACARFRLQLQLQLQIWGWQKDASTWARRRLHPWIRLRV